MDIRYGSGKPVVVEARITKNAAVNAGVPGAAKWEDDKYFSAEVSFYTEADLKDKAIQILEDANQKRKVMAQITIRATALAKLGATKKAPSARPSHGATAL